MIIWPLAGSVIAGIECASHAQRDLHITGGQVFDEGDVVGD